MEQKLIQELLRLKLLMGYDSSKTYYDNLNEQFPDSKFERQAEREIRKQGEEERKKREEEEKKNTYPNYCSHKEFTVWPSKTPTGAEGKDALITNHCLYKTPQNTGIWLHKDAQITFWNLESLSKTIDSFLKQNPNQFKSKGEWTNAFSKTFPIGTVKSFKTYDTRDQEKLKSGQYNSWYRGNLIENSVEFLGYYLYPEMQIKYVNPSWVDVRTDYQRLVDKYGIWVQLGAAALTVLIGFLTGGAAWVVYLEIAVEGVLGTAVGLRELEKGENVMAGLSLLTGFLPAAKLFPYLRGVKASELKGLSQELANSKLTKTSSSDKWIEFYSELSDPQKKIMSQLLEMDDLTRKKLINEFKQELIKRGQTGIKSDEVIKSLKQIAKENPSMLKDLTFFEKLWARELTANLGLTGIFIIIEFTLGKYINEEDKECLLGVYQSIPDQLKKEFAYNIVSNAENLEETLDTQEFKEIQTEIIDKKAEAFGDNMAKGKWIKSKTKEAYEKVGGIYKELEGTPKVEELLNINNERIKNMRNEGWVTEEEYKKMDPQPMRWDVFKINGVRYIKIKQ